MNQLAKKPTILEKIQSEIDALEVSFMASGAVKSRLGSAVTFKMEPNVSPHIHIGYYDRKNEWTSQVFKSPDSNPMHAIRKARNWIAKIPAKEDLDKQEFIKATASLIEMGKKIGVDVAFVNPLEEMMKKLSENAITYDPYDRDEDQMAPWGGVPSF